MTATTSAAPSVETAPTKASIKTQEMEFIVDSFSPDSLDWRKPDWTVLIFFAILHVGCLFAPFYFTWQALAVACALHFLTACVGVTLGYHRYLSHKSLKLATPAKFFVSLCGVISGEGPPLRWAATHRLHHARSDHEGDPHSPNDGSLWSHILWLFVRREPKFDEVMYRRFVPDLVDDKMLQFFNRTFGMWLLVVGVALLWAGGLPMLIWGMCVRMVVVYHGTWFVNSATHLWGYRNYETKDMSRNLWWVGIIAYGEGWHNNHHAFPALARAGHRWWEFDATFWVIRALQSVGLAWDVKDRVPSLAEKKHAVTAEMSADESAIADERKSTKQRIMDSVMPTSETISHVKAAANLIPATAAAVAIMPVVDMMTKN